MHSSCELARMNPKTFYVAGRLENFERVRECYSMMAAHGWELTFDWTKIGAVRNDRDAMSQVAVNEIEGARKADVLIALLPGGRGTHCEIGAALSWNRGIVILSDDPSLLALDQKTTAFYHHPLVIHAGSFGDIPAAASSVFRRAFPMDLRS